RVADFFSRPLTQTTNPIPASGAPAPTKGSPKPFHKTKLGTIYLGDSLSVLRDHIKPQSVDLIMTSPPFGLVRKKDYGNVDSDEYLEWFRPFGTAFKRVLKDSGSLVIDIG